MLLKNEYAWVQVNIYNAVIVVYRNSFMQAHYNLNREITAGTKWITTKNILH